MAKIPVAGKVKTRLQPFLSPEKCAELAAVFLQDTIKKTQSICKNIHLAYSPAAEESVLETISPPEINTLEQTGADLGEKMSNAFDFVFKRDSDSAVVMIGTDSPTFPVEYLEQAFGFLEKDSETVLGKSIDGGFYLLGLRKSAPQIFKHIEWSSAKVYAQIAANIENFKTIPEWFDVDTPDDFIRLRDELQNNVKARSYAPETFRWLSANQFIFDSLPSVGK
jgi:rSAM/selenodomain-associated transferase 1